MSGSRCGAAVLVVALLARALLLLAFDGGPARALEGDERGYAAVAGSLARGEGFGFTVAGVTAEGEAFERRLLAFRAPLLPLVLAPVHAASDGSPAALRWACALLGALAAPLAFAVAARLGGNPAGWIAGLAVALWPSHAWLSVRVLSEPLDALLLLAGADLLLRRRPAAGGVALGLAVLCRPGSLVASGLCTAAAASVEPRGRRLRSALCVLAGVALLVAPWVVRNRILFGRPLFVTSNGVTLLGGNCEAALSEPHPGKWVPPERSWGEGEEIEGMGRPDLGMYGWSALDEETSDVLFTRKAKEFVEGNPAGFARLVSWKVLRFLDPDTRSGKGDAALKAWAGWLSWGWALPCVAAALWIGRRERSAAWRIALALLAGHLLGAAIFYGDARVRAPVEPALLALLVAPLLAGRLAKWTAAPPAATVSA